jgi:radical SAM protein with 4Fe4S-binding SPASM domain
MLDVSALYGGLESAGTPHRYGRQVPGRDAPEDRPMALAPSARQRRPVVVWNLTRACNLRCLHCYTDSSAGCYPGELTTRECQAVLEDLRDFEVPAVLFSGGEPLLRPDFFELVARARQLGLRVVVSTNGTLIDARAARRLRQLEVAYVGISLDSAVPAVHDRFRGVDGAFGRALEGIRRCLEARQKVGLRLTLTPHTCRDLSGVFHLAESEKVDRACFYHLCPAGRGQELAALPLAESRRAVDAIFDWAGSLRQRGRRLEVLTVDNHCDGAYLYLRMLRQQHPQAGRALEMLAWNGGARYSSGVGIANIDSQGRVHADQFSTYRSFGEVRRRRFSEIWQDASDPVLRGLRDRLGLLKGRCASCRFNALCGGSLRARAELVTGDPWAPDPGCYLTEEEIAGESVAPDGAPGGMERQGL